MHAATLNRVVFLLAATTFAAAAPEAPARPNVLWIVADDLGWGDLSFRNGGQIKTPVLENFAREGAVLTNYYVQASCSPSRATFMTGRYPRHHGINAAIPMFRSVGLALNETTVAQLFRSLGYATHAIGKWHIGALSYYHTPTFRGFQSFYGFYGGIEDYKTHKKGKAVDFRRDEGENCGRGCSRPALEDVGNYSTKIFTNEAVRLVEDKQERGDDTPWFMYLAYQAVHFPGQVPQRYSDMYRDVFPDDENRMQYAGMLTDLDESVGKVLDAVNKAGQLENTVVVFTTDNGGPVRKGASNAPLRGSKGELWEGGTRGTAMLRGPGVPAGSEYASLMHCADWLPTLLGAADSWPLSKSTTLPLDGLNLWDSFRDLEGAKVRENVFYGATDKKSAKMLGPALRVGDYKLLLRGPEAFSSSHNSSEFYGPMSKEAFSDTADYPLRALYDLRSDPGETTNLAAKKPQKTRRMLKRLKAIWEDSPAVMDYQDAECAHPMNKEKSVFEDGTEVRVWEPECDHLYMGIFATLAEHSTFSSSGEADFASKLPSGGVLEATVASSPPSRRSRHLRPAAPRNRALPWAATP